MLDYNVLFHSSIRISDDKYVLYFDPFRIQDESHDADYIFITHSHFDHLSSEDIAKVIKKETVIIAPESVENEVRKAVTENKVIYIQPSQKLNVGDILVETIHAYNKLKPFHPKRNNWVGYIVTISGKRIYVAGDTDLTKEALEVKCDIAMVPVGGKYTVDAKHAAKLVNAIMPEVAVPTHYGEIAGKPNDADEFAKFVDKSVEVKIMMYK